MKLRILAVTTILLTIAVQNANAAMADGSLCARMKAELQGFTCDSGGGGGIGFGIGGGFNERDRFAENSGRGGSSVGSRGNARSAREKVRDRRIDEAMEKAEAERIERCKKESKKECK